MVKYKMYNGIGLTTTTTFFVKSNAIQKDTQHKSNHKPKDTNWSSTQREKSTPRGDPQQAHK